MGKVHLLSLGCPKNMVDSENLLKKLDEAGLAYSPDPLESEIIIVNTCGFIEAAKKESIEEILKIADLKRKQKDKKIVVFGCLAERFGKEIRAEIPEIDVLWGVGKSDEIVNYCTSLAGPRIDRRAGRTSVRSSSQMLSDKPYAYLKIAEGCDRGCSYCVIPSIRGSYASRDPDRILAEAEEHIRAGIRELILVAQDITSYGKGDGGYGLENLVRDVASIPGDFWVRLLYLYPTSVSERLVETISTEEKVCKYIDMPLQHSEDAILRLMGRAGSRQLYERLISQIRRFIPEVCIRTSLIVGFPQETERDFDAMLDFVREMKFDRLGAFTYSREEGTKAAKMKGQVPKRIREERYGRIMEAQSIISLEKNTALVGKTFRVLVDETDGDAAVARLSSQAPEIDGVVFVDDRRAEKGSFVDVEITEAYDYDLRGVVIS